MTTNKAVGNTISRRLRRLVVLSPEITAYVTAGSVLLVAMIFLGATIWMQVRANEESMAINYSSVHRPFSQLSRQILLFMAYVQEKGSQITPEDFSLQRGLLTSRWKIVFMDGIYGAFPENIIQITDQMKIYWQELQVTLDQQVASPTDVVIRTKVIQQLHDLETTAFQGDIEYQSIRNHVVVTANEANNSILLILSIVSFLLVGFVAVAARSIIRHINNQKRAEEQARIALAAEATAVESIKFKDQFLAVMSHELRTPLNAIIGFLGIMSMSGKLDNRNGHMVQRARANAERLLNIINDILDINKIESGRYQLFPAAINVRELTGHWQFQIDILAKQKGINFNIQFDDNMSNRIWADEHALSKIAINLLSNAIKFTEKGDVTLKIWRQQENWCLRVTDTGIGIPEDMHEIIFESFRQVDTTFQRAYGGTGLGLAIVSHLVKAMDGTVRVQSTVGVGSQFTVTLPLKCPAEISNLENDQLRSINDSNSRVDTERLAGVGD